MLPEKPKDIVSGLRTTTVEVTSISDGTAQHVIYTTQDKLELCIRDFRESYVAGQGLVGIGALFVSLFITLLTASFERKFGLAGEVWHAIFVICTVGSAIWFIMNLIKWFKVDRANSTPKNFIALVKSRNSTGN